LHRLEIASTGNAAAHIEDDIAERDAHGHLDEAGVVDLASEGENGGSGRFGAADVLEPRGAAQDDPRRHGVALHIVDVAGLAPQPADRRERRARTGFAAATLNGGDQCRFLSANKRAGPALERELKGKVSAQDLLAQQSQFVGLSNGGFQPVNGQRIFLPTIDETLARAHGETGNGHALNHRVRIAFQNGPVHERAGVTFVGVADDILHVAGGFAAQLPLEAGGKAAAAAAAQPGFLDFADDFLRRPGAENAGQGAVAVAGDVFLDFFRIDPPAIAQGDAHLLGGEGEIAERRERLDGLRFIGGRVAFRNAADHPLADGGEVDHVLLNQARHHVRQDIGIEHVGTAVELDIHQRLLGAHAETAHADQLHGQAVVGDLLFNRREGVARAGGDAAGAGAHRDDRAGPGAGRQPLLIFFAQQRKVLDGGKSAHGRFENAGAR